MPSEPPVGLVVSMGRERGARGGLVLLAHHFLALHGEDVVRVLAQHRHFRGAEAFRQKHVTELVESRELLVVQTHRLPLRLHAATGAPDNRACEHNADRGARA